ncbi:MAG: hypothetical protein KatS3mg024_0193 [Armatimonadota bacterium]|nr:MAG: hypothetical protein KatS3mg024_0193 [Armatimonadota bacterium]
MRKLILALLCIGAAVTMVASPTRGEFAITSPAGNHLLVYSNLGPTVDAHFSLDGPLGVAFSTAKDIWFAEYSGNRVVRMSYNPATNKWTQAETVSVPYPRAVITDEAGILYIVCADQKIWKYQGGVLTHWATTSRIDPVCMAWGPYGRLWVTCNDASAINVFDPSGGSPVLDLSLWNAAGITSGPDYNLDGVPDMYVNDRRNYVHVLSGHDGTFLGHTVYNAPELGQAFGMVFGADANADGTRDLYICDWSNGVTRIYSGKPPYNHIRLLNNDSALHIAAYPPLPSKPVSDGYVVAASTFNDLWIAYNTGVNTLSLGAITLPYGTAMQQDGSFWVTSPSGGFVRKYIRTNVNQWSESASFNVPSPTGVAIGPDGAVYVASDSDRMIYRWDGSNLTTWAGPTAEAPRGISFGPGGRLWVCCIDASLIQVWDANGLVASTGFGTPIGIAPGPDQTGDGVPDMYVVNAAQQVHVVDSALMQHWDRWVFDPERLANPWGVTTGLDQDFDGVPDIYVGQFGGQQVGIHVYSGRTGAYIRYLNNDPVGHIAAYPVVYSGLIPLQGPGTVIYKSNFEGVTYVAPGVSFNPEWPTGWALFDTDPKTLTEGRMLGSFNQTNALGVRNLPPHSSVTVTFDLILAGLEGTLWHGNGTPENPQPDRFGLSIDDGDPLMLESFSQDPNLRQSYPGAGVDYPGHTGMSRTIEANGMRYSEWRNLSFTVPHNSPDLTVLFQYQASSPAKRYWLDNVRVSVKAEQALPPFEGSIGAAKQKEQGRTIVLNGKAVTAFFFEQDMSQSLYVEEEDRSSGIKVYPSEFTFVTIGDRVKVTGKLQTDSNGELSIGDAVVEVIASGQPPLVPLGVNNQALTSAQGIETTGLLVRTWGRVTAIDGDYFFVNDGSGYSEVGGPVGLRVRGTSPVPVGGYVHVTGIRAKQIVGGNSVPVIRMRDNSDAVSVE